jgi:hypothetical protein
MPGSPSGTSDIAAFAAESTWDELADAPIEKYAGVAPRLVLRNAIVDHERFERSGAIARFMFALRDHETPISRANQGPTLRRWMSVTTSVCRSGMLMPDTNDKGVYVLVVTDRVIHE